MAFTFLDSQMRMLIIDIFTEKLKLKRFYIYIYIYIGWVQVTLGVTLKNATPLNIFLIACAF